MQMKVLITGGAGFIGSAVAKYLTEKGFAIRTLDIIEPKEKMGEHFLGSIMHPREIAQAMKGCDYVIHLAAMLGVRRTELKRMECLDINIQGTKNILEACLKTGVKKIVFASSSEVYGDLNKTPLKEDYPVSPKSVYGITKLAGEEYVRAYKEKYGLDFSILRFFNVYGPSQVAEFVMPRFIRAVQKNNPPTVYGNGEQTRAFCYIDDVAKAVFLALTKKEASFEVFNVGNDKTKITMKELAEKIIKISGKNLQPKFLKMAEANRDEKREIFHRLPDISKARKILGFEPKIGLEQGIKTMLKSEIQETWFEPMR